MTNSTNTSIEQSLSTEELPDNLSLMQLTDALLKTPRAVVKKIQINRSQSNLLKAFLIVIFCYLVYGLIVGSFSGHQQWFFAPIKIVGGTIFSTLLCYPSFYIMTALGGANLRPSQAATILFTSLAISGILLTGFAPVAFIFTFATNALPFMGMLHICIWSISIYFAIRYLNTGLATLGVTDQNFVNLWAAIFIITMLQMTTTLRPILGESPQLIQTEKQFFLDYWLKNANKSFVEHSS